jgi:hypothetical protein
MRYPNFPPKLKERPQQPLPKPRVAERRVTDPRFAPPNRLDLHDVRDYERVGPYTRGKRLSPLGFAVATARWYFRFECQKTERVQLGVTPNSLLVPVQQWALQHPDIAKHPFITRAAILIAADAEHVRVWTDGMRTLLALRIPMADRSAIETQEPPK